MPRRAKEQYLSRRRAREITRENRRISAGLEKRQKRRNVPERAYLTEMKNPANVLEIEDLKSWFFSDIGVVRAVDGVSFSVPAGKTVGVVGESGCGKSVTALSVMRLLQRPHGQIAGGEIRFNLGDKAYDIAAMPAAAMRRLRGRYLTMIFQEPMTSLDPVFRIGDQVGEAVALYSGQKVHSPEVKKRVAELLELVGIANSRGVAEMFPHELSGGMRQRVMIAMALACDPKLIIADEPTTALDVTIQAQILDLLRDLKNKINASVMLITHDLGVVAEMADEVVVMYAGRVVEKGTVSEIFSAPAHPYTIGLMASKPVVGKKTERLYSIPGKVPNPIDMPDHCYFRDRCQARGEACEGEYPPMVQLGTTHFAACYGCFGEEKNNGKNRG